MPQWGWHYFRRLEWRTVDRLELYVHRTIRPTLHRLELYVRGAIRPDWNFTPTAQYDPPHWNFTRKTQYDRPPLARSLTVARSTPPRSKPPVHSARPIVAFGCSRTNRFLWHPAGGPRCNVATYATARVLNAREAFCGPLRGKCYFKPLRGKCQKTSTAKARTTPTPARRVLRSLSPKCYRTIGVKHSREQKQTAESCPPDDANHAKRHTLCSRPTTHASWALCSGTARHRSAARRRVTA